jgi:hypothetical protein
MMNDEGDDGGREKNERKTAKKKKKHKKAKKKKKQKEREERDAAREGRGGEGPDEVDVEHGTLMAAGAAARLPKSVTNPMPDSSVAEAPPVDGDDAPTSIVGDLLAGQSSVGRRAHADGDSAELGARAAAASTAVNGGAAAEAEAVAVADSAMSPPDMADRDISHESEDNGIGDSPGNKQLDDAEAGGFGLDREVEAGMGAHAPDAGTVVRRRKRLALAVVAIVVVVAVAAIVAGVSVYLTTQKQGQTQAPEPPPAAHGAHQLVPVATLQRKFNQSLSESTLRAIDIASTSPAMAYRWLFASGDHPDLPGEEAIQRMVHRFALAALYYSTDGGTGTWTTATNWLDKSQHECLWFGVLCDDRSNDLASVCISELHLPSVSCRVSGTHIDGLDLSGNRLVGSIPEEVGLLSASGVNLILLKSNNLGGSIPSELGALRTLRTLSVAMNQLAGDIPDFVWNYEDMVSLDLASNYFDGTIPEGVYFTSPNLRDLFLDNNNLKGSIPADFGDVDWRRLHLNNNRFKGAIPSDINAGRMEELMLHNNQLSGSFPAADFATNFAGNQSSLTTVTLYNNNIQDDVNQMCDLFFTGQLVTFEVDLDKVKCDCCTQAL